MNAPSEKHFGGCRLERVQSRSEHSLLYRAFSEELARPVMIKLLDPRYSPGSNTARRFLRGGELARELEHPHIVQTFAAGLEGPVLYMLMEFLEGHSLDRVLSAHAKLPYPVACDIVRQVAGALEYAGRHKVIHRKLEPSHIMLSPGGRVRLLGFGLARLTDTSDQAITAEGSLVGVSPYSPPEVGEHDHDVRGDLYSLGAVLYHMLGGRPPFSGTDPLQLLHSHRTEPVWPIGDLTGGELPAEVEQIIDGLLAKDPDGRLQTPAELIACLDAVLNPDLLGSKPGQANQTLVITTREMMALRHKQRVLVCDDQVYNISLLEEVLRRLGFETMTTRDGRTAIEALEGEEVELLLTDLKLPGLGGEEFIRQAHALRPSMPIVISRAGAEAKAVQASLPGSCAAIIERPLDPYTIRNVVLEALR